MEKILEVKNLEVSFRTEEGIVKAVQDVSFDVYRGRTLGIVGESGSGKSVSALAIMGLIPNPPGFVSGGQVFFGANDLLTLSDREMRQLRGKRIAMIFQEPMTSLNPVYTVGQQIEEVLALHRTELSKKERKARAIEMLDLVGIPGAAKRVSEYPHQLSGGMRQRVMIAIAIACEPELLIADEPTTALDATIQAQILELLKTLQEKMGMGIIFITHDLGVVAETCDSVSVMYCGRIVENAPIDELFRRPRHPYTSGLLRSIPGFHSQRSAGSRLQTIPGTVPPLSRLPPGCSFQNRCPAVEEDCRGERGIPLLTALNEKHLCRCFHPLEGNFNEGTAHL